MRWIAAWALLIVPASAFAQTAEEDVCTSFESLHARLAERVAPAVVSVHVERERDPSERNRSERGGWAAMMDGGVFKHRPSDSPASGFILDADGWILTSHFNVSGNVRSVTVTLADGRRLEAAIRGSNATFDIALLKVEAKELPTLRKAPLEALRTGQFVAALGRAPDGRTLTLNPGIVSAPGRLAGRGIQVDCRLNYGNAGGPVVDREGRLLAVACKVDTKFAGSYGQNSGVGFAVTWDKLDTILPDLRAGRSVGESRKAFLGIQANSESEVEGVEIDVVQPASAAEKAGVKRGDIVVEFEGRAVRNFDQLRAVIAAKQPGDVVKFKVKRGGETLNLEAKLGWAPGE